ncbi:MAG: hypothetical protein WD995_04475 [Gemmatimonadota bacterium]
MKIVSGIYHDAASVTHAVRALLAESIPADSIGVTIHEASGRHRRVKVGDEAGVLEGAVQGAWIGAALGTVVMTAVAIWVAVGTGEGLLPVGPFSAAISGALGGAAAGVMLGALIGMGRWKGMPDLDPATLEDGSVVVSVRSDALVDTAQRVLSEAGADRVEVTDGREPGAS